MYVLPLVIDISNNTIQPSTKIILLLFAQK